MSDTPPLTYWYEGRQEIPYHMLYDEPQDVKSDFFFLALDIAKPLHRVLEVEHQSLKETWKKTDEYIKKSLDLLVEEYNEDYDELTDCYIISFLDHEQLDYIRRELEDPPSPCYSIYLITVGSGKDERLVYVGKTSSSRKRFAGGHLAALKLHDPKYSGLEKKIYFCCITFLTSLNEYVPLEWIHPLDKAEKYLSNVENGLIYTFQPELNTVSVKNNHSKLHSYIHIQNFSGISNFLNDKFISFD